MRDKSYNWSEAAEDWANETLGEDNSHQIALSDTKVTPHIETFTPTATAAIPDGFTCEDTPCSLTDLSFDDQENDFQEMKGDKIDDQIAPTIHQRRTIIKVTPKQETSDTDTFVFSQRDGSKA
ncbi:MAG: hypothetical protein ABJ251_11620 [Paracoccaceae bacterium]